MLLKITWQDRITNAKVLVLGQSTGIDALLIASPLRWSIGDKCYEPFEMNIDQTCCHGRKASKPEE